MMLAQAENLDILHDDHLVVPLVEDCAVDHVLDVLLVALGEEEHGLGVAGGGVEEAFAVGVFAHALEEGADCGGHLCEAGGGFGGGFLEASAGAEAWGRGRLGWRLNTRHVRGCEEDGMYWVGIGRQSL